jgi:peptidoglycan hydrolase-like protein with peptidoglycan-binding domain
MTRIWDKLRRIQRRMLIRSRGFSMQTGFQPSHTRLMQSKAARFPQICLQIGQAGLIGGLLLIGLNALPVSSQEAQTPASPNSSSPEILPLESSRITLRVGSQGTQVAELQAMLKLLGYYRGVVDGVYQESTAIAVTAFQQAAGLTADGVVGPSTWGRLLPVSPAVNGSATGGAIAPSASSSATPDTAETTAATLAFPAPSSIEPTAAPSAAMTNAPAATNTANPAPAATGNSDEATSAQSSNSSTQATAQPTVDFPILRVGMRGPAVTRLQERLRATGFFNGAADGVFGTETQNAVRAAQRSFSLEPDGVVGPATWGALLR